MTKKQQQASKVCTIAVRIAKHLAQQGITIRSINVAKSSRSCYLKVLAQQQKITIRISDHAPHPGHYDARTLYNYSTRKDQHNAIQALQAYLTRLTQTGAQL